MSFMRSKNLLSSGKISATLIVLAVFLLAGFFIYQIWFHQVRDLEISFEIEEKIFIGQPFDVGVILTNNSPNNLKNVELAMNLPAGAIFIDRREAMRKTIEVGNLDIGETYRDAFKLMVLEGIGSSKEFVLETVYLPVVLNRSLVMTEALKVDILPAVDLKIGAPEKVMIGEEFEWSISYENISTIDREAQVEIFSPAEFLTDFREYGVLLQPKERKERAFRGQVMLPEGSIFQLGARLKSKAANQEYTLAEQKVEVVIAPAPLSFRVLINNQENIVAGPGETLQYELIFRNNTTIILEDLTIETTLRGEMYDFGTLETDGFFNPVSRSIIWNSARLEDLKNILPGESKKVGFNIRVRSEYPIRRINDKNFVLRAESRIESPTVPYLVSAAKTINFANAETKVRGNLEIEANALFRDAASRILNQGPWPPEVGQATEFTVHWTVYNYATDVSGVEARVRLEPNVVFTGRTQAEVGKIYFDEQNQEVVWQIPNILATSGIISEPLAAVFQIRATPILQLRGGFMPLLKETTIIAQDEFARIKLNNSFKPLTTALEGDPTVNIAEGMVR